MRERAKRLYSPWAIPGWIIVAWKVAEMWDTMNFILEQLSPVGRLLSSPLGTIVVLLIGFGILIYAVVRPERKRVIPQAIIDHREGDLSAKQQLFEQILDDDKTKIGSRIYARDYMWDFKKLTEPDPYIDLVFTIINAMVFAINVMGVTGRFLIEEHECAQVAEFIGSKRIPHGESQNIRIRQRLTREMAELIINRRNLIPQSKMDMAKKGKINISLRACELIINAEIEGEPQKNVPIAIGRDYEVNIS